jgi:hypothetical protein
LDRERWGWINLTIKMFWPFNCSANLLSLHMWHKNPVVALDLHLEQVKELFVV